MNRDNYYIILELSINPPETDSNKIETAIQAKQAEWSRLRNHPTKGRKAQQYLGWLSDIKRVMLNDATARQKEAEEAQKIASEKFKKLDNYIAILAAKGYVLEDEVTKLVKDFTILAEAEIKHQGHFNLTEFNSVNTEMEALVREWSGEGLLAQLKHNFKRYAFFGVSALGCNPHGTNKIDKVISRRVTEPFLWLLWLHGLIHDGKRFSKAKLFLRRNKKIFIILMMIVLVAFFF